MSGTRSRSQGLKVKWSQNDLNSAFKLVEEGTPIRAAARSNGIPFSTLQERLKNKNFQKVATIPKAEAGFAGTGIYPLNPDVFTDEDFLAAEMLNSSELEVSLENMCNPGNKTPETQIYPLSIEPTDPNIRAPNSQSLLIDFTQRTPGNSPVASPQVLQPIIDNAIPSTSGVTAKDLLPVPKKLTNNPKVKGASRKQHATVLTNTPFKEALAQKEERRATREKRKESGAKTKAGIKKTAKKRPAKSRNVRKVKKRVLQDENEDQSSSDSEIEMTDVRDDDDDTDVEENRCMLCDDYGRNNELWYRCVQCGLWAHAECSGYDSPEGYVCDLCR